MSAAHNPPSRQPAALRPVPARTRALQRAHSFGPHAGIAREAGHPEGNELRRAHALADPRNDPRLADPARHQRGDEDPDRLERRVRLQLGGTKGLEQAAKDGRHFLDFNTEQQASICGDYYSALKAGTDTSAYEPFINEVKHGGLPVNQKQPELNDGVMPTGPNRLA